jgi:predicted nucleic acid-binding protein
MPPGPRKDALRIWLARDLPLRFRGRTLPVDGEVAHRWGELAADGRRIGRPLPVVDGLLLATASTHNLTFVTRNLRDCGDRGVPVLDPWA